LGTRKKKAARNQQRSTPGEERYLHYVILAVVIGFLAVIRLRLLNFPLERDEGEYAYAAQLMLRGISPYHLCYTMKLPGTAAAYALMMGIFGQTPAGIHLGLLLVNSATTVLMYFLGARFFGKLGGLVAAATFGILSLAPSTLGFAAHATQFVALPAVAGILLMLKALESPRLSLFFWCGLLLGLAFLMKQPGILFGLFAFFYLATSRWRKLNQLRLSVSEAAVFAAAYALPITLTVLVLALAGDLPRFWFWVYTYAAKYGAAIPLSQAPLSLWENGSYVVSPAIATWLFALAGIVGLLAYSKARKHAFFLCTFLLFSFAAVCPGFYFRPHYFILLLPAVSLLCAAAIWTGSSLLEHWRGSSSMAAVFPLLFFIALGYSVAQQSDFFFELGPLDASRSIYGEQPFPEAIKIGEFLRSRAQSGDRLAVMGSEPEIYFYSHLLSATGYIYAYPFTEPQPFASQMQKEMIAEVVAASPKFLIFVDSRPSWINISRGNVDMTVFQWTESYARENYRLIGIVDLLQGGTQYHFEDAQTYHPRSQDRVFVFEKKA
jgi:hypothetical protein